MKNLLKIMFSLLCVLAVANAYALRCMPAEQQRERYENAYLMRIVSIDENPQKEPHYGKTSGFRNGEYQEWIALRNHRLIKKARIEVLKIYKGNIKKLSKLETITITVACLKEPGSVGYGLCEHYDGAYPYQAGDKIVVFNDGDTIYYEPCALADKRIKTDEDLAKFEETYKPIWEKPAPQPMKRTLK